MDLQGDQSTGTKAKEADVRWKLGSIAERAGARVQRPVCFELVKAPLKVAEPAQHGYGYSALGNSLHEYLQGAWQVFGHQVVMRDKLHAGSLKGTHQCTRMFRNCQGSVGSMSSGK